MELIKEIHDKISLKKLYEDHGIDINEVVGVSPQMGGGRPGAEKAGEQDWRAEMLAKKQGRAFHPRPETPPAPQRERGAGTSPEVGDMVILPGGQKGKVRKNFMNKVTVTDESGAELGVFDAGQMVGPGKSPEGGVTWAVKR